ncbi:RRT15 protein, partial [Acromyrmex insinuator]
KFFKPKGSIGRTFAISMRTEHRDQASFCPFVLHEVSVFTELALGHLRYTLTDVPPQSNSPPGSVLESDHAGISSAIGRGLTPL